MITATNLTASRGKKIVFGSVNLEIEKGEVIGIWGANASGKSTLIRLLAGLESARIGQVLIDNMKASTMQNRRRMGYLPQRFGFWPELNTYEVMMTFAAARNLPRGRAQASVTELIELVDLSAYDLAGHLTPGQQKRLGMATALVHDPEFLFFDDLTADLDATRRSEIAGIIAELAQLGKTIVLTSPRLADLVNVCNRIVRLKEGQLEELNVGALLPTVKRWRIEMEKLERTATAERLESLAYFDQVRVVDLGLEIESDTWTRDPLLEELLLLGITFTRLSELPGRPSKKEKP